MKVVIVGGVAGGASAAARLRRMSEDTKIIMLEKGEYISYANCGLPYYIGGLVKEKADLLVQTAEGFAAKFSMDVRVQSEVLAVNAVAKTVQVKNLQTGEIYIENYDKLLLAPGATPVRPPLPGVSDPKIFTLRTVTDTFKIKEYIDATQPKTAVIVGGGFIGIEMAENLVAQGIKVSVVEQGPHLVPTLDGDMAILATQYLKSKGVEVHIKTAVQGFEKNADGLNANIGNALLPADIVILAVGVRADTEFVKSSGIAMNSRGGIVVDEYLRTSDEDIYAVGDAIEVTHFVTGQKAMIALAGPANKQGRIVADTLAGVPTKYSGTQGSSIMKIFDMTVASTGVTENGAKAAGILFDKVYSLASSHADYYPGAKKMSIKLLFEKITGRVLGVQIVGFDGVDKRCDVAAVAIRAKMTVSDLTKLELCYAPPYSSSKDPINMIGYAAENVLTGQVKQYYWEDYESLPKDGSVIILDVRRQDEYDRAHEDGSVHIPLDELRGRLTELDIAKPIYVTCHSGARSYLACRILDQNGYDAYNFAGGYRLRTLLQQ